MCDIDHVKQVNDRFGHAGGDRVLRAIGTALDDICVDHLVARYGGEEFAVLFTGVSLAHAEELLERARASVSRKRYRLRESDAPLGDRKITRLNSSHYCASRMPSSACKTKHQNIY